MAREAVKTAFRAFYFVVFLYHYGDINLSINIDGIGLFMI